jgi:hypothetical protein
MQQLNLPMTMIAGYCFNVASLISLDMTRYAQNETDHQYSHRSITLTLIGPTIHTFKLARADEIYDWYLGLTGQKKMELVSYPERTGAH